MDSDDRRDACLPLIYFCHTIIACFTMRLITVIPSTFPTPAMQLFLIIYSITLLSLRSIYFLPISLKRTIRHDLSFLCFGSTVPSIVHDITAYLRDRGRCRYPKPGSSIIASLRFRISRLDCYCIGALHDVPMQQHYSSCCNSRRYH